MHHVLDASLLTAALLSSAALVAQSEDPPPQAAADDGAWTQAELERLSESIRVEIEGLRKQEFTRPVAVEVASAEVLIDYAKKRIEKTETAESLAAEESSAKLLGLIPPGMDLLDATMELLEGQVGGFYDPDDDKFYLMETFKKGDLARVILSHELTHALDDQLWDIDGTFERVAGNSDAERAYHAVVEGSGTRTMTGWVIRNAAKLDMSAVAEADFSAGLEDAPAVLWKPLMASYMAGAAFLDKGVKADRDGFLARAFEEPPTSTEQVLHPELYWDAEQRDEPRRIEFDLATVVDGWDVLTEDTLGELMLALVTTPVDRRSAPDASNPMAVMALQYTNAAATGWGGDRVILLGRGDARLLRLVTVWDTDEDAAEFEREAKAVFATLDDGAWAGEVEREITSGEHLVDGSLVRNVVLDVRYGETARAAAPPAWLELPAQQRQGGR